MQIMFVFVIYNSLYIPIELSFTLDKAVLHCAADYIIDFLFIMDMVVNLRTTYYDDENELVVDARVIRNKYLFSHWFIIDFVAVFPFDLVVGGGTCGDSEDEDEGGFTAVIKLLKAFRLLRLVRFRKELDKLSGANILRTIVSLSVFLPVAHWLACIWWAIGKWVFFHDEDDALDAGIIGPVVCDGVRPCSWLRRTPTGGAKLDPRTTPFAQQYLTSLYWSLTTLMKTPSVGPDRLTEKIFAIFAIALGAVFYAFFLSTVQGSFQSANKSSAQKREKLASIGAFSNSRNVPADLSARLVRHTTAHMEWTAGLANAQVLQQLPSNLRGTVALSLYTEAFQTPGSFFKKASTDSAKGIIARMTCQVMLPDQVLIAQGEACATLYVLLRGVMKASAEIVATGSPGKDRLSRRSSTGGPKGMNFRDIERPGAQVGLIEPISNKGLGRYPFQVSSSKKSYLLSISQANLATALDGFPDDVNEVRKALAGEHRQLTESLKVPEDPDSPLGLMAKAAQDKLDQEANETITEDTLARVTEVERTISESVASIDNMREDLEALPKILALLGSGAAIKKAAIPDTN